MSETEVVKNLVRKSIVKARFRGSSTKMRRIEEFINRLVSNLGLDPEVKRIALEFVRVSLKAGSGANIKTFHGKNLLHWQPLPSTLQPGCSTTTSARRR
ncbi:hypothetical protein [Aeropyrum camini]|uniref:hypothetical protein n=1 Tax=Aeropyrum camini TaxID=229980 RepID=UPI000787235C|nr:hypothetical protein [Aeropyrum camini]